TDAIDINLHYPDINLLYVLEYITPFNLCFSLDNSKLYISCQNFLVQFDLNAGEEQDIQTSRVLIASIWDNTYTEWFGDLQIAPNGKIYVARAHSKYMSVINNPNDIGNSCNFDHNILSLNNFIHLTKNRFGLPNFASNFLLPDDVAAETCPQLPVIDTFF